MPNNTNSDSAIIKRLFNILEPYPVEQLEHDNNYYNKIEAIIDAHTNGTFDGDFQEGTDTRSERTEAQILQELQDFFNNSPTRTETDDNGKSTTYRVYDKVILKYYDDSQKLLHKAAKAGYLSIVSYLLDKIGFAVHLDYNSNTLLHSAVEFIACNQASDISENMKASRKALITLLLKNGYESETEMPTFALRRNDINRTAYQVLEYQIMNSSKHPDLVRAGGLYPVAFLTELAEHYIATVKELYKEHPNLIKYIITPFESVEMLHAHIQYGSAARLGLFFKRMAPQEASACVQQKDGNVTTLMSAVGVTDNAQALRMLLDTGAVVQIDDKVNCEQLKLIR